MDALADLFGFTERQLYVASYISVVVAYLAYRLARAVRFFGEIAAEVDRIELLKQQPVVLAEHRVSGVIGALEVIGRIDEVRRMPNRELVLGDIKTRKSAVVHEDDIVELSLYRALFVQQVPAEKVSTTGYIRFVDPDTGAQCIEEVKLRDDDWVQNLARAYHNVRTGRRAAYKSNLVSVCGKCEYVRSCYRLPAATGDDYPVIKNDGFDDGAPGWSIGGIDGGL